MEFIIRNMIWIVGFLLTFDMYVRLINKPFYFLTDRSNDYLYFVDNTIPSNPKKILYYPQQFETMSASQISSYKNSLRRKFLFWAIFNPSKLTDTDKKICYSKLIDCVGIIGLGIMMARITRRLLFRIEIPVLEQTLENIGFNIRITKALISYSISIFITYTFLKKHLDQRYLIDLAFEYHRNFSKIRLKSQECDKILDQLSKKRFNISQL